MAYKIITKESGTFSAADVVADIAEEDGPYIYYMFLGKHTDYVKASSTGIDVLYDNEKTKRTAYQDMLFGKKIKAENVSLVIDRHTYLAGEVYDIYDDTDQSLFTKNFFVVVQEGSSYDVFKCLENYNGAPSTVQPSRLDTNYNDEIYRTSDNYVWKYMYTISSSVFNTFATDTLIPVIANSQVSAAAVDGSIDVIKVENTGSRYDNYLSGTLGAQDVNVDGSNYKIKVSGNNTSSAVNNFYIGCVFKIVSGPNAGDYSTVTGYNGTTRVITLQDILGVSLNTSYEISPGVTVIGDGYQTSNAFARAIISPYTANGVDYIEVLDRGSGYRLANASINYNSVVPVATVGAKAYVRPIIAPPGGHGHDANNELGASRVCFSVTFNPSTDGLPAKNDFRQVGVMTNPNFSNVVINFSSKTGNFQSGETVYKIDPLRLYGTDVTINTTSNSVTATVADFQASLTAGDYVYLSGSGQNQLSKIISVPSSNSLVIDSLGAFSCTDTQIYMANVSNPSFAVNDEVSGVAVSNVKVAYGSGDKVIGDTTGAYGVVSSIKINGTTTDLSKFYGMWRYQINTSDTFLQDEKVYQTGMSTANGKLFAVVGSSNPKTMYVTQQLGIVDTGQKIYGNTSLASADVLDKYQPDINFESGRIIYLENLEPVTRSSGQKETFKVIFEY